ncbi:uncharacterized protein LTR77_008549 [Saxophila tyrrhenica]|uniref:HPP transmembrane region domain-containing protein n=1 Tax=Saxophila tyrrhenica TaxID=1690608 RepID=A0AAV9P5B8_9PEZI|nr:hypothetical protein LTR77_008549 [Saxophila tyrrhenica]
MPSPTLTKLLDPNIDTIINPFVPHNQVRHFPTPIAHFLGYRKTPSKEPPSTVQWLNTVLATVAGICVVGAVYNYAPGVAQYNPPTIVASLGASAVLDYNTVRSPLAQPRNSIVGHTIAAIVGTGISKAFQHAPSFFANYGWVAAAVACAASSVAMSMTNTVHPPGGATAILACTDATVIALGWMFPALMLLASVLMVAVACVFNNVARQYPVFWWTPEEVGRKLPRWSKEEYAQDEESEAEMKKVDSGSDHTLAHELSNNVEFEEGLWEIRVEPYKIRMPHQLQLSDEEVELLKQLQARVRMHSEVN